MLVVYYSLTGNVKEFVSKLKYESLEINSTNPFKRIHRNYVLIAPTYEYEATEPMYEFIECNDIANFKGVIGSGEFNFNEDYIFTAKDISKRYNVPLLADFEKNGSANDVSKIIREIDIIATT
ncbi:ribonucleotide reductase stimulatory protein [Paraliobacillus ryukyuensis]|uniref:ribonucleotide reductase stimulatory protein n=1 Tax=Paraliobacillus ryukyuensis TaxID=200904 RepID=UPI0009A880A0|nr:class Ib ribonucleoside-diphosphate reductase assembly flavoprotein NrdI [Paraliobacillus ryukyuensis]